MVSVHDIGYWLWVVTQAVGPGFYIQVSGLHPLLSVLNTIDSNKIQIVRLQSSSLARGVQNTKKKKKFKCSHFNTFVLKVIYRHCKY